MRAVENGRKWRRDRMLRGWWVFDGDLLVVTYSRVANRSRW